MDHPRVSLISSTKATNRMMQYQMTGLKRMMNPTIRYDNHFSSVPHLPSILTRYIMPLVCLFVVLWEFCLYGNRILDMHPQLCVVPLFCLLCSLSRRIIYLTYYSLSPTIPLIDYTCSSQLAFLVQSSCILSRWYPTLFSRLSHNYATHVIELQIS